jgi:mono/diheme cytochrome c family protein
MKIKEILIALIIITISACGGRNKGSEQQQQTRPQSEIKPAVPESLTASGAAGKKVYDTACLVCHMANGTGVPGMFPPLAKTDWVTGDKDRLIRITIQGLSGKIEVNGVTYNSIMPPNSHLSDREIADVLTYIRQSFGNNANEVTLEEVQRVRADL